MNRFRLFAVIAVCLAVVLARPVAEQSQPTGPVLSERSEPTEPVLSEQSESKEPVLSERRQSTGPVLSERSEPKEPVLSEQSESKEIRIGIIGTDTSHVTAFTKLLNDRKDPGHVPGARVVAAFKGGSPDVDASRTRVDKFAAELKETWGVEFVDSIEALAANVDAVLLASVDGRVHLSQVRPVFKAKKRVFIDKPFTASYADAREIVRLSRESGVPFFSSSSLRYAADIQGIKSSEKHGGIRGAFTFGPENLEPHHPDLFWYGIHAVEMLYTLLGPGCEQVTRVKTDSGDTVVGRWKDGRIGTMRGLIEGKQDYGAVAFGMKAVLATPMPMPSGYRGLLVEIVKFFQTGVPPVDPDETLEIIAFMEAAELSKARGGAPVLLADLTR